ncbi:MAG: hypothetical protein WA354_21145 [Terracidiphilus sp.]
MLYPTYPQPYGSELSINVKDDFAIFDCCSLAPGTWADFYFPRAKWCIIAEYRIQPGKTAADVSTSFNMTNAFAIASE